MARLCWHGRNQVRAAGFSNQKFSTRTRPNPVRVCVRFAFGKRVHDGERVLMEAWRVRQGEPGSCGASIARVPRRVPYRNLFAYQDGANNSVGKCWMQRTSAAYVGWPFVFLDSPKNTNTTTVKHSLYLGCTTHEGWQQHACKESCSAFINPNPNCTDEINS